MIYWVDNSAFITSDVPSIASDTATTTSNPTFYDSFGLTFEDRRFVQCFLAVSEAISNRNNEACDAHLKDLRDVNAILHYNTGKTCTLLYEAVEKANAHAVQSLLNAKANPDITTNAEVPLRDLAVVIGNKTIIDMLQAVVKDSSSKYAVLASSQVSVHLQKGRITNSVSLALDGSERVNCFEYKEQIRFFDDWAEISFTLFGQAAKETFDLNFKVEQIKNTNDGNLGYRFILLNEKSLEEDIVLKVDYAKYFINTGLVITEKPQKKPKKDDDCFIS